MNPSAEAERDARPLPAFEGRFIHPRFWGIWLVVGWLRLFSLLPYAGRVMLGNVVGSGLFHLMQRRRQIARTNLSLCFPDGKTSYGHISDHWVLR